MSTSSDVDLKRVVWAGPLAVAAAVLAVCAVRAVAGAVLDLQPDFPALTWGALASFTVFFTVVGVAVFVVVAMRAATPIATYRRVAFWALVLSLVPDLALPFGAPPATWTSAVLLMLMHVAAWWPFTRVLTTMARRI